MSEFKYYLRQPPPHELIEKFVTGASGVIPDYNLNLESNLGNYQQGRVPANQMLAQTEVQRWIKLFRERPNSEITGLRASFNVGFLHYLYNPQDNFHFHFQINSNDNTIITNVFDFLSRDFQVTTRSVLVSERIPEALKETIQVSNAAVAEFAAEASRLAAQTSETASSFASEIVKKTQEMDELLKKRVDSLEKDYRDKVGALDSDREAYKKEVAAFELRNNTAVRRDLLRELRKIIDEQKQPKFSAETVRKRQPITYTCIFLMAFGIILASFFGHRILENSALISDWHMFIPVSVGTFIFVSTGIYFLRWTNLWFRDHARAESGSWKFEADMVRASWLAELVFEWESKKGEKVPEQLLVQFTKGLFVNDPSSDISLHPIDDLTSIAKSLKSLKVDKSGVDIQIGK